MITEAYRFRLVTSTTNPITGKSGLVPVTSETRLASRKKLFDAQSLKELGATVIYNYGSLLRTFVT